MRSTWDALASDPDAYVGDPARGREELDALFGRLGADPRGGTCIEVGSGPGRMTAGWRSGSTACSRSTSLPRCWSRRAPRFRTSTWSSGRSRASGSTASTTRSRTSSSVTSCCSTCRRATSCSRTSRSSRACSSRAARRSSQLPVLEDGLRPRAWRAARSALVPLTRFLGPTRRPEFRGYRLRRGELDAGLARAGLRVVASDFGPDAPYRYSRDLFLRLTRDRARARRLRARARPAGTPCGGGRPSPSSSFSSASRCTTSRWTRSTRPASTDTHSRRSRRGRTCSCSSRSRASPTTRRVRGAFRSRPRCPMRSRSRSPCSSSCTRSSRKECWTAARRTRQSRTRCATT